MLEKVVSKETTWWVNALRSIFNKSLNAGVQKKFCSEKNW